MSNMPTIGNAGANNIAALKVASVQSDHMRIRRRLKIDTSLIALRRPERAKLRIAALSVLLARGP